MIYEKHGWKLTLACISLLGIQNRPFKRQWKKYTGDDSGGPMCVFECARENSW